jgi:protoporphyrinogen/coproporphyrinogen III oxidase
MKSKVLVIGSGISGLTIASTLKKLGVDVLVLESGSQVGGSARSISKDGYLCETGPHTLMLSKPDAIKFLAEHELLASAVDAAPHAKKRFIVKNQELAALPTSPASFFTSKALTWKARLAILAEPLVRRGGGELETIAGFVRRRLGRDVLRDLVGPLVSGIYAGDPERLIARYALPDLVELEENYGGLILGMFRKPRGPKRRLISWPNGMSELSLRLVSELHSSLILSSPVRSLRKEGASFIAETESERYEASHVVVATDALNAAKLLSSFHDTSSLEKLSQAAMAVVHLGFRRSGVTHPLDGFGALIARHKRIRTLGVLFSSTLFPGRAPNGQVLLTCFMGGRFDPDALSLNDPEIIQSVLNDLTPLLGIIEKPIFQNIVRWPRAIPQYERDYPEVLKVCDSLEQKVSGLHLIGNYRGGISLQDRIVRGLSLAKKIAPSAR